MSSLITSLAENDEYSGSFDGDQMDTVITRKDNDIVPQDDVLVCQQCGMAVNSLERFVGIKS